MLGLSSGEGGYYSRYRVLAASCQLSFEEEEVKGSGEEAVVDFVATTTADVGPTLALAGDDVTVVVIRAAGVAVAGFAPVRVWQLATTNNVYLGSGCSTAVEHTPHDSEVVGSNPTGCWAFFSDQQCVLNSGPSGRCNTTAFPIQLYLATQLEVNQS